MTDIDAKRILGAVALLGTVAVVAVAVGASASHSECNDVVNSTGSIQASIDAASEGDTICIDDGTYEESLTVDRTGLTLRNHNATDHPVVQNPGTLETGMEVLNETVTIRGINVTGFAGNGINLSGARDAEILEVDVSDNGGVGIDLQDQPVDRVAIRDSTVSGNGEDGILVRASAIDVVVENSTVTGNAWDGINVQDSSDDVVIRLNDASGNGLAGIEVAASVRASIVDNTVADNSGAGVFVGVGAHNATVRGNAVTGNGGVGIEIEGSDDSRVADNTVSGSGAANVEVDAAPGTVVEGNTLELASGPAVSLVNGADGTIIRRNTVTGASGDGVSVDGSATVTVRDNEVSTNGLSGIVFTSSPDGTVANNTVDDNGLDGIAIVGTSDHLLVADSVVRNNSGNGILLELGATDATVRDTTVSGNGGWAFDTADGGINSARRLDVGASTRPGTTLSFEARNVSVRGNGSTQPGNADAEPIGRYLDAEGNGQGAYLEIDVHYLDSDVPSDVDESTLGLWDLSGGSWIELASSVDASANVVSANVTGFSPLGVFGQADTSDGGGGGDSGGGGGGGGGDAGGSAEFVVTSAVVNPENVTVGTSVKVTASVENQGDGAGTEGVVFDFGDGTTQGRSLTLAAGETATVSLSHAYGEAGSHPVTVEDVSAGTVTVVATGQPAQSDVRVTDAWLSPAAVTVGEPAEACATLVNDGGGSGSVIVEVTLDGSTETTEKVTVAAGGEETVCQSFTPSEPGEREVRVSGATAGTLTVNQGPGDGGEGGDGEATPGFGPVAVAVSLVVVARIVERRR